MTKPLLAVLRGETPSRPPIWLMRQAGRYLPEYRELRARAGSFMKLCLDPELAAEVTLQPVTRFGMDGAIIFSDILIVPYGLGHALDFVEGEGPRLQTVGADLPMFDAAGFFARTAPIFETVRRTCAQLPSNVAMIGFAGSPFTVACYMLGGKGSDAFVAARRRAAADPVFFENLLGIIADTTVFYLSEQVKAGAEALQLFDSWSNLVEPKRFAHWVIAPTRKIVDGIRALHPHVPLIGFPRGSGAHLEAYVAGTKIDAVSVDQHTDMAALETRLACALQGNLDPALMAGPPEKMLRQAACIMESMKKPFIFNLGHGLTPDVPPANVAALVAFVHSHAG